MMFQPRPVYCHTDIAFPSLPRVLGYEKLTPEHKDATVFL